MLNAYLSFNKYRVAEIKLDLGFRNGAKDWAMKLYNEGYSVFLGRYSVKTCKWRWTRWIPGVQINHNEAGTMQPEPYRSVNKTNATM